MGLAFQQQPVFVRFLQPGERQSLLESSGGGWVVAAGSEHYGDGNGTDSFRTENAAHHRIGCKYRPSPGIMKGIGLAGQLKRSALQQQGDVKGGIGTGAVGLEMVEINRCSGHRQGGVPPEGVTGNPDGGKVQPAIEGTGIAPAQLIDHIADVLGSLDKVLYIEDVLMQPLQHGLQPDRVAAWMLRGRHHIAVAGQMLEACGVILRP